MYTNLNFLEIAIFRYWWGRQDHSVVYILKWFLALKFCVAAIGACPSMGIKFGNVKIPPLELFI